MRIGIVCPYSFDVPGGVQFHVRDLAEHLLERDHDVSVLIPADDDAELPSYVVPAGRAVPVPYNGSVARLSFGPLSAARVRKWLGEGGFDVLHVHEPASPSLSLLACWAANGPTVGTFHTSITRSRAMVAAYPILIPTLDKLSARIAVSEDARRTLVDHLGGDAVVIPNGVYVDRFAAARPRPEWRGGDGDTGGTLGFIGRLDEPRKGLPTLLGALEHIVERRPHVRLLVAGRGDAEEALEKASPAVREAVHYLGQVSEADKAALLATVDAYVAPNLGGESFGIILVEAMAAGAPVVASDLSAFRRVLDDGALGRLFPTGDERALADTLLDLLSDDAERARLRVAGSDGVRRYDWSVVADDVLAVYETVTHGQEPVREAPARPGGGWRARVTRGLESVTRAGSGDRGQP
ncbi:MAG: glycosyltransferase family 4 protein [Actinomycetales bacterium]